MAKNHKYQQDKFPRVFPDKTLFYRTFASSLFFKNKANFHALPAENPPVSVSPQKIIKTNPDTMQLFSY